MEEEQNQHFLSLAGKTALLSNCKRRQIGALIVRDGYILISAANSSPPDVTPCNEGGCIRCNSTVPSGDGYDSCICIHAEQLAIAKAAGANLSITGGVMYVTLRPCLPCLNLCLHSGITRVIYSEEITFKNEVEIAYSQFLKATEFPLIKANNFSSSH